MPRLAIYLFGSILVTIDGEPVRSLYYDKVRALLAYLAVESHLSHRRESLAGLLWPEYTEASARQNLSQALYRLRNAIGDNIAERPFLTITPHTISFSSSADRWLDTKAFVELTEGCATHSDPGPEICNHCLQKLQQALSIYRDDFLHGFSLEDSPEFENWLLLQREQFRLMAIKAVGTLARCHDQRGEYEKSAALAQRWLKMDPWDEGAHRQMMRALAGGGQRALALRHYEKCCRILQEELGVEPSDRTTDLYEELRGRSPAPAMSSSAPVAPVFMAPPLPPQGVLGREETIQCVVKMLDVEAHEVAGEAAFDYGVAPTVALQGMGGIGKTTLALALTRLDAVAASFPDGVFWASLGPAPTIRTILDGWGRLLNIDLVAERDEKACSDRLRSVFHFKRSLLVIDDVWEAEHGNYFAIGGPHCRTLYTTRESPVAHALATRTNTLRIDVFSPQAALLLLHRLAPQAVEGGESDARRLCEQLGYLPLAVTLAGRMLANESDVPARMQRLMLELIEEREVRMQLLQPEGRLGLAEAEPASLQSILGMSIGRLTTVNQERFAMLTVFGSEPLVWDIEAAAHVWNCPVEEAQSTVSSFVKRGLVVQRDGHYWVHALLADYAKGLFRTLVRDDRPL